MSDEPTRKMVDESETTDVEQDELQPEDPEALASDVHEGKGATPEPSTSDESGE